MILEVDTLFSNNDDSVGLHAYDTKHNAMR